MVGTMTNLLTTTVLESRRVIISIQELHINWTCSLLGLLEVFLGVEFGGVVLNGCYSHVTIFEDLML